MGSVSVQRNLDMDDALAERHPKVLLDVFDHGLVHDVLEFGEPVVAKGGESLVKEVEDLLDGPGAIGPKRPSGGFKRRMISRLSLITLQTKTLEVLVVDNYWESYLETSEQRSVGNSWHWAEKNLWKLNYLMLE